MSKSLEDMQAIIIANPNQPVGFATSSTLPAETMTVEEILKLHEQFKEYQKQAEEHEKVMRAWLREYILHFQMPLRDLAGHLNCTEYCLFAILYQGAPFPTWLVESITGYFTSLQEDQNNGKASSLPSPQESTATPRDTQDLDCSHPG